MKLNAHTVRLSWSLLHHLTTEQCLDVSLNARDVTECAELVAAAVFPLRLSPCRVQLYPYCDSVLWVPPRA